MKKSDIYFNPYRSNLFVLKKFCGNPFTLIVSIIMIICSLLGGFVGLLPAVAFFLLWITSKSKSELTSYTPSLILTVIYCVINSIGAAACSLLSIILYRTPNPYIHLNKFDVCVTLILTVLYIVYSISMLEMIRDFRISVNRIYLRRKGSAALCIFSSVLFAFLILLVSTLFLTKYNVLPFGGEQIKTSFIYNILLCNGKAFFIFLSLQIIKLIFITIFAVTYLRYIHCTIGCFHGSKIKPKEKSSVISNVDNKNIIADNHTNTDNLFTKPFNNGSFNPYSSDINIKQTDDNNSVNHTPQSTKTFIPQNPFEN